MRIKGVLIIVDIQNDFCPGGALPVPEGDQIIPVINKISSWFEKVVCTQDWHPENHVSFARTHNKEVYEVIESGGVKQVLWPEHCVCGTRGAAFHRALDLKPVNLIMRKGVNPGIDSYSAFLENDRKTETGLHFYLNGFSIRDVYVCGLATDFCVYYTCLDARSFGFNTFFIQDAARGIDQPEGNIETVIMDMKSKGVMVIEHTGL